MTRTLTRKEIRELEEAFKLFDKNKDERICAKELENVMNILGQNPSPAEVRALIDQVDIDGNGTIEFDEFIQLMARKKKSVDLEQEMRAAFKVFDKDKNGFISPEELRTAMGDLGEQLDDKQLQDMVKAADLNGDGLIDYKEFTRMMMLEMSK